MHQDHVKDLDKGSKLDSVGVAAGATKTASAATTRRNLAARRAGPSLGVISAITTDSTTSPAAPDGTKK